MRFGLMLAGGFFFLSQVMAQTWPAPCGTYGKTKWLTEYQNNRDAYATESDTGWLYIPITITIVGKDDGTGYFPKNRALKALCRMNNQFEQARIKCYLHPVLPWRYLNKSSWYEHDWSGGQQMITQNNLPNRVNAYIVKNPAGNCGYAWYDAIVLGSNCSSESNSTWSHELGHHLSLPHPFVGWEGRNVDPNKPAPVSLGWGNQVEKVERSNCLLAADGFCDTGPDYISDRWNCDINGQSYPLLDPDSVSFKVDGSYIMGYANDACQSRFTPDQIAAMRANLRTEHSSYLSTNQHGTTLDDDSAVQLIAPIDSAQVQFNQATFTWHVLPKATDYVIEIGLNPNFAPTLHFNTTSDTSYTYTSGLPKNRVLYWRVKAFNRWDVCEEQSNWQIGSFWSLDLSDANELEKNYSLSLTPNPVSSGHELQVTIQADRSEAVRWTIFDITGRLVAQATVALFEGEQTLTLPVSACVPGQYRLVLQNERGLIQRPFAVFE